MAPPPLKNLTWSPPSGRMLGRALVGAQRVPGLPATVLAGLGITERPLGRSPPCVTNLGPGVALELLLGSPVPGLHRLSVWQTGQSRLEVPEDPASDCSPAEHPDRAIWCGTV